MKTSMYLMSAVTLMQVATFFSIADNAFSDTDLNTVVGIQHLLCTESRLCKETSEVNITEYKSMIPGYEHLIIEAKCCKQCSCDIDTCLKEGTCCPDMFDHIPTIQESRSRIEVTCEYANYMEVSDTRSRPRGHAMLMVRKCPDTFNDETDDYKAETKDKCENPKKYNSFEDIVPVTDTQANRTYQNIHCSKCYHIPQDRLVYWNVLAECKNAGDETQLYNMQHTNIIETVKASSSCNLEYKVDLPSGLAPYCLRVTTECNVTGKWEVYDPLIEAACRAYSSMYDRQYQNVFCVLCNEFRFPPGECRNPGGFDFPPSFSVLLDFNPAVDSIKTNAIYDGQKCSESQMFDKLNKVCRNLRCRFPNTLNGKKCVSEINKTYGGSYVMYLKLQPPKPLSVENVTMSSYTIHNHVETLLEDWGIADLVYDFNLYYKEHYQHTEIDIALDRSTPSGNTNEDGNTEGDVTQLELPLPPPPDGKPPSSVNHGLLDSNGETVTSNEEISTTESPNKDPSRNIHTLSQVHQFEGTLPESDHNGSTVNTIYQTTEENRDVTYDEDVRQVPTTQPVSSTMNEQGNTTTFNAILPTSTSNSVTDLPFLLPALRPVVPRVKPPPRMEHSTNIPENGTTNSLEPSTPDVPIDTITIKHPNLPFHKTLATPSSAVIDDDSRVHVSLDYFLFEIKFYFKPALNLGGGYNGTIMENILDIDGLSMYITDNYSEIAAVFNHSLEDFSDKDRQHIFLDRNDDNSLKSVMTHYKVLQFNRGFDVSILAPEVLAEKSRCPLLGLKQEEISAELVSGGLYVTQINSTIPMKYVYELVENDGQVNYYICADMYLQHVEQRFTQDTQETRALDKHASLPQRILSVVCTCLSIICGFLTLVTYFLFKELRTQPGINNICLITCLIVAQLLFQFGLSIAEDVGDLICILIGICVHYFWLMTVTWMSVCSYHMFMVFIHTLKVRKHSGSLRTTLSYISFCTVSSALFVVINILVSVYTSDEADDYGYSTENCYISRPYMVGYVFALPVALLIATNLILFIIVIVKFNRMPSVNSDTKVGRNYIKIYAKLSSLTGVTWVFGFLYAFTDILVFEYLFVVLNASQGVFIFLAFVLNNRVIKLYKDTIRRKSASESYEIGTKRTKTAIVGSHKSDKTPQNTHM